MKPDVHLNTTNTDRSVVPRRSRDIFSVVASMLPSYLS